MKSLCKFRRLPQRTRGSKRATLLGARVMPGTEERPPEPVPNQGQQTEASVDNVISRGWAGTPPREI